MDDPKQFSRSFEQFQKMYLCLSQKNGFDRLFGRFFTNKELDDNIKDFVAEMVIAYSIASKAPKAEISYEPNCDIKGNNPSLEELTAWYKMSGLPLKKFFNTSGILYKSMQLKDKLPDMSEEEQLKLLSTDGMLVKRPLLTGKDFILVGFKESEWSEKL